MPADRTPHRYAPDPCALMELSPIFGDVVPVCAAFLGISGMGGHDLREKDRHDR